MEWPKSRHDLPRTLLGTHTWAATRPAQRVEALEARVRDLEIELAARQVIYRYAFCYDAGDLDRLVGAYTDDCVVVNRNGTFVGRETVRANYARALAGRSISFHHVGDVYVVPGPDRTDAWATGYLYAMNVKHGQSGGSMASFAFHLREERGEWKIAESRIHVSGRFSFGEPPKHEAQPPSEPTEPESVRDLLDDI